MAESEKRSGTDERGGGGKRREPGMHDVARVAGVSHQTVSRVINNHPSIRSETRQRVLEAIAELDYRPNRVARALVTRRSHLIGVITASGSQYGPGSITRAIEKAAQARGYFVSTVTVETFDPETLEQSVGALLDLAVEGFIVIAPQKALLTAVAKLTSSVPFVTVHQSGLNTQMELSVDQHAGARRATRHLIDLGHRRIAHIAGPGDWFEAEARVEGFVAELREAGLDAAGIVEGDWSAASGYRAGAELLARGGFTAVFSANDQMALGLMHAASDAGLEIAADLSVVGFDDMPEAEHFRPPLTTVRQDFAEIGRRSVAVLLGEHVTAGDAAHAVVPELIVRQSTAPPPVARP